MKYGCCLLRIVKFFSSRHYLKKLLALCLTPTIPAFRKLRQEDREFQACLSYATEFLSQKPKGEKSEQS